MKALISDLGGVLVHFSLQLMAEQIAAVSSLSYEQVNKILFDEGILEQLERGQLSLPAFHSQLCTLSQRSFAYQDFLQAACNIFKLNEEMVPFLEGLKAKQVKLVLLSNTCEPHFHFIRSHFSILNLFDAFALSYEIGARKPEEKIYRTALQLAQCSPEECFYIDDIKEYTLAAKALGIPSETFHSLRELSYAQTF